MIKCFLSHSSKDKEGYVRIVAKNIKSDAQVYDENTFEKGMATAEEIINGLEASSLFVIFLSNHALESEWVRHELVKAKEFLDDSRLSRIFPIIIDPSVTHDDDRIPKWMRDETNIQLMRSPNLAARKINARLIEIAWDYHPKLKEKDEIFVGRHELLRIIEERLNDFNLDAVNLLVASGLQSIGRRSLLREALKNANLIRSSAQLPQIVLGPEDSIEDLIQRLIDVGFSATQERRLDLNCSLDKKLDMAKQIFSEIEQEHERVLIDDRGCLVQPGGKFVDWFDELINEIDDHDFLTLCIASRFRPNLSINQKKPSVFIVYVDELDPKERASLFVSYAKFRELELNREDYQFFTDILSGYPHQVFFAVDLIKDKGLYSAKKESHLIQQYASDKAKVIVDQLGNDEERFDFLIFLSKFEFVSYEVLFDIVDENKYAPILFDLLSESICEHLGANGEYVRVNEVIRDYVSRSRIGVPSKFQEGVQRHVSQFIKEYDDDNVDVSDYIFSAQQMLAEGKDVPEDMVIPSVFLKTIKYLYDEKRKYKEAIALADRVLQKERFVHEGLIQHVRFIQCQCLARSRNPRFFSEVRKIQGPERDFLYGFYFRLDGQLEKAEESFKRALESKKDDPRILGELVLVYMAEENMAAAIKLARTNYYKRPNNPFNANNYFACLIHQEKTKENRRELESIMERLSLDASDKAREMLLSQKARFIAFYEGDKQKSYELVSQAAAEFNDAVYPLLTRADLAVYFRDLPILEETVESLSRLVKRQAQTYRSFVRYKAIMLAMKGELDDAKTMVSDEFKGLSERAKNKIIEMLENNANV